MIINNPSIGQLVGATYVALRCDKGRVYFSKQTQ